MESPYEGGKREQMGKPRLAAGLLLRLYEFLIKRLNQQRRDIGARQGSGAPPYFVYGK